VKPRPLVRLANPATPSGFEIGRVCWSTAGSLANHGHERDGTGRPAGRCQKPIRFSLSCKQNRGRRSADLGVRGVLSEHGKDAVENFFSSFVRHRDLPSQLVSSSKTSRRQFINCLGQRGFCCHQTTGVDRLRPYDSAGGRCPPTEQNRLLGFMQHGSSCQGKNAGELPFKGTE